jgi:uncharacterized protein YhbP (UPF0306 family)
VNSHERHILEEQVLTGRLMQVATQSPDGPPELCHVWYAPSFTPDRLYFISRKDRHHSQNIHTNPVVAGGIVARVPEALGEQVQGVTYRGHARQVPVIASARLLLEGFLDRWPQAKDAITWDRLERRTTLTRLYEITVTEWILFDEVNFPENPRRVLPGQH